MLDFPFEKPAICNPVTTHRRPLGFFCMKKSFEVLSFEHVQDILFPRNASFWLKDSLSGPSLSGECTIEVQSVGLGMINGRSQ